MATNLDLDLLRTFVAIAEEQGFSAAAAKVLRSQSAVSQQMQRLETQIGVPLFMKEGRRRVLTQQGQNLLHYAQQMIELNDRAVGIVRSSEQSGTIRIGSPYDIADSVLPRHLSRFAKTYPNVHVVLTVDRSPHLMPLLAEGKLDFTLTTRHSERFEGRLLRTSPTVWIGAAGLDLDPRAPIPLVMADEPSIFRSIALSALERHGQSWIERYTCPTLDSIHVALVAGLGITARTPEMLTSELKIFGERNSLPPLPDTNFYVYRGHHELSEAAEVLFDMICTG